MRAYLFNRFRVIGVFALLAGLSGCNIIGMFLPDSGKKDPPPLATTSVSVYIDDATALLKTQSNLTDAQAETSRAGARNVVTAANLSKDFTEEYAGLAVEGAVASIGGMGFTTDDARIAAVDAIMEAYVAALNTRLAGFETATASSRATDAQKTVVSSLLARLARAAVKSLQLTGVSAGQLPDAAGGAIGSMVSSLGSGGITSEYVNSTVGAIAKAAVESLTASGMTSVEVRGLAVHAITSGAVIAAASTGIVGVGASDVGALVAEISCGASQAAADLYSGNTQDARSLVQSVARGSVAGIKAAMDSGAVESSAVSSLIAKSVEGASEGVSDSAGNATGAIALIGAVTQATSQAATAIEGQDSSSIARGIAQAASTGAATSLGAGISAEQLATAIVLQDSTGASIEVDVTAEIGAGIAEGTNSLPVAEAGPDQIRPVGENAVFSASASSDTETAYSDLAFEWTMTMAPAGSGLSTWMATGTSATVVADVAGTYRIRLRVTDGGGKSAEDFAALVSTPIAGVVTFEGMTAAVRLADANTLRISGRMKAAQDQYLLVLNKYIEVPSVFAEALYWLGHTFDDLGQFDAAIARYDECMARYPATAWANRAKVSRAWGLGFKVATRPQAKTMFEQVRDGAPGTAAAAEAVAGLAYIEFKYGSDLNAAYAQFASVLTLTGAEPGLVAWMPIIMGEILGKQGNSTDAIASYESVVDGTFFAAQEIEPVVNSIQDAYGHLIETYRGNDRASLVALVNDAVTDTDFDGEPFRKLQLASHGYGAMIYDFDNTAAEYAEISENLRAALTAYAGTDAADGRYSGPAAWGYVHIGNAYNNAADTLVGTAMTEAVGKSMVAFQKVIDTYPTVDRSWPAAHARSGIVAAYLWRLEDYAAAETAARAAVDFQYPVDVYAGVRALAADRMGQVLQRQGWNARKDGGSDHVALFEEAISWFEKANSGYYPGTDDTEWFVQEAKRERLDCLIGLDRYADARSAATALLGNPNFDTATKASIAVQIPKAYRAEIGKLAADGNFDKIMTMWTGFSASIAQVAAYKDDSGKYVKNGAFYAEALLRYGEAVERFTGELRWRDLSIWADELGDAGALGIQKLDLLCDPVNGIAATFASLPRESWIFFDAYMARAQILRNWGSVDDPKYALSLAAFEALYEEMTRTNDPVPYSPPERLVWLLRDWAYLYDSRGDLVDLRKMKYADPPALQSEIDAKYAATMTDFEEAARLYNECAVLQDGELQPDEQAKSFTDAGRMYRRMLDLSRDYYGECGGVLDAAVRTKLESWYSSGLAALGTVTENDAKYLALDNGGVTQRAWRFLGELHMTYAWYYESLPDYDTATLRSYIQSSVDAYRNASDEGTYSGVDPHQLSESRRDLVGRLCDLADTYRWREGEPELTPGAKAAATALFSEAYEQWALLIVDPMLEDDNRAWATKELGWNVQRLWDLLTGVIGEGVEAVDLGIAEEKAELGIALLTIVVDQYPFIDDGRTSAEARWERANLHERAADWFIGVGGDIANAAALVHLQAALADAQALVGMQSVHPDWWCVSASLAYIDQDQNGFQETRAEYIQWRIDQIPPPAGAYAHRRARR